MRWVALITGASGGIGADLARVFAREGYDLALVARSADKLEALADTIVATGRPRPIVIACDLAASGAVEHVARELAEATADVSILVNNAGYGLIGRVDGLDGAEQLGIVDLNIRVLVELTLRFLPSIKATRGKILNVGSIVSYMPGPGMAVYYASKAFVRAFSLALGEELKGDGVTVTALHPGLTLTGFHERARAAGPGKPRGMASRRVAEAGYAALVAGRGTIVPGLGNKLGSLALPLLPDRLLLPIIHRVQRSRR